MVGDVLTGPAKDTPRRSEDLAPGRRQAVAGIAPRGRVPPRLKPLTPQPGDHSRSQEGVGIGESGREMGRVPGDHPGKVDVPRPMQEAHTAGGTRQDREVPRQGEREAGEGAPLGDPQGHGHLGELADRDRFLPGAQQFKVLREDLPGVLRMGMDEEPHEGRLSGPRAPGEREDPSGTAGAQGTSILLRPFPHPGGMAELSDLKMRIGDPAPPYSLPGTDGKVHRLEDLRSSPLLLVVFSCNHCPYAQAWEGRLIALAQEFGPRGMATVMINPNETEHYPDDRMERMVERARQKGYPFPYLRDDTQQVARAYGALVTPHAYLFDARRRLLFQGRVDDRHDDPAQVHHPYLRHAIQAALDGRPIEPETTSVLGCSIKWRE